jgi:signal transduction histidine kinase
MDKEMDRKNSMKRRKSDLPILFVSVFLHLLSLVQFQMTWPSYDLPQRWYPSAISAIVLSLVMAVGVHFTRNRWYTASLLLLRLVLLIITSAPIESSIDFGFTILISIFLDTSATMRFPMDAYLSVMFLFAVLIVQRPIMAWGKLVHRLSVHDAISIFAYVLVIVFVSSLAKERVSRIVKMRQTIDHLNSTIFKLTDANTGFQRYAYLAEIRSAADERSKITSEIHDSLGYTMTNIIMMAEVQLQNPAGIPPRTIETLRRIKEQAQNGHQEIRSILRALRGMATPEPRGLKAYVRLAQTFERATGTRVHIRYGDVPGTINEEIDTIIYSLIQEGLTNAFRHGRAKNVRISLWKGNTSVSVAIQDDGESSSELSEGIGIEGLRSRLHRKGGRLHFSRNMEGFEMRAELPVDVEI